MILLPGLLYWRTLAPTVFAVDSVEFTTGAYTLGLVHPPGYPTYLLLGRLFLSLPVGDFGYRLNLMSAVFGVLSCWVAYRILLTVGVRPLFAGLAGPVAGALLLHLEPGCGGRSLQSALVPGPADLLGCSALAAGRGTGLALRRRPWPAGCR